MVKGNLSKQKTGKRTGGSYSDKVFDVVNVLIMCLLLFVFFYPLYFVVIASFSDPNAVWAGKVILWPEGLTLRGYEELFRYEKIWTGYKNNIIYTVVGTAINVIMTVLCAYPLSRKDWYLRGFFMKMCLITMYFGGGLIPTYLVIKKLGLVDTGWAMMIPGALSFYNALIARNYFMNSIPESLQEAAELDGANSFQYLVKIVMPLSKPVLAVVGLYYAVGHWNDYYTALIYIYDRSLVPLQTVLKEIFNAATVVSETMTLEQAESMVEKMQLAQTLKYTSIVVSVIPMMIVYPFVQKFFVKGVMIGAIKG